MSAEVRSQESEIRRTPAKTFEDLIVWQKAHELFYRFTR
jgi:hypothetical protein